MPTTLPTRTLLSTLWIFLTVNYIFCDVFTLMYAPDLRQILTGTIGDMALTQEFLLTFAIIMELAMVMIVLSRLLPHSLNRWLNLVVALLLALVQAGSLFADENTLHYMFFSVIEVATALWIAWLAWQWKSENSAR